MKEFLKMLAPIDSQSLDLAREIAQDTRIISGVWRTARYYDEPLLYQYTAQFVSDLSSTDYERYGGGSSFIPEKAYVKAVCEAVERCCISTYQQSDFLYATYSDIRDRAIPIHKVVAFSEEQALPPEFHWDDSSPFYWVRGVHFDTGEEKWIPAQLIYVPYTFCNEKIIRLPISTGAAAGRSMEEALLRGALEIIERDAFMIHYLTGLGGVLLDLKGTFLEEIKEYFRKYELDLMLFYLPTDLEIHTILSLIIDRTGVGPAVSAGLKSGIDPSSVAIGAIEESWHSRPWIRDAMIKSVTKVDTTLYDANPMVEGLGDLRQRGLFWSTVDKIAFVKHFIENPHKINFDSLRILSTKKTALRHVSTTLSEHGHSIYYVDVTQPSVREHGCNVVKVVIPTLHPLYLDDRYPYLGGDRLLYIPKILGFHREISTLDLNLYPHFFL